jgi:hypothetical protein
VASCRNKLGFWVAVFFVCVFSLAIGAEAQVSSSVASLSYPLDGASQINPSVTFTWGAVSGAQVYYLYVGSSPGLKDVYDSGETTKTGLSVSLATGTKYYARLYAEINNTWHAAPDISFTTVTPSVLLSPANQAAGLQRTCGFSWSPVAGASAYYLYVGSSIGTKDVVDSGEVQTTQLTRVLNGGTYYARIYTLISAHWYASPDITFSVAAPPTPASLTSPTSGSSLFTTSPVTFSWTTVPSASVYYLYVGTTPGANDVINSGEIKTTQLTRSLSPGIYYARIYTEIAQLWYLSSDITFSVIGGSTLAFPGNAATNVDPYINFTWQPFPGASSYSLTVGTTPGASDALATGSITSTSFQLGAPLQSNTTYYVQLSTFQGGSWFNTNSSFTTGTGIAHLLAPTDGETNVDPFSKLSWTSVADAQTYYVYVGSALGLKDIYDSGEVSVASLAVPILKPETKYFVRLYTEKGSNWYSVDTAFTTGNCIAQMLYPLDKAINVDPGLPFQWSSDPIALGYQISIGTSLGSQDVFSGPETPDTTLPIRIPASGSYYIRLTTIRADGVRYVDSSFTASDYISHLVNPGNQALMDPFATFTWASVPGADAYYLTVGSSTGARDIFDSGEQTGTSIFVPNLVSGITYFARLYTYRSGFWYSSDSTFLAGKALAALTDPQDGAFISPLETFSWSVPDFPGDAYYLIIGSTPGARDIFDSGGLQGTSVNPNGLDFGKTYYATLFTLKSGFWKPTSSTFTTFDQNSTPNLAALRTAFYAQISQTTAAVRMMADPTNNAPVLGSPLASFLQSNNLQSATCVEYATVLNLQLAQVGVKSRLRYMTLTGTASEAHTTVEYYDPFLQKWSLADATFGALYFDPATQTGQSLEEVQALVLANNFAGIHITTVTTYGDSIFRAYYMDPLTLYANITPPDQMSAVFGPPANSPFQFLQESPIQDAGGQPGTYIFVFGNVSEQTQIVIGGSTTTLAPRDGTLFSTAITLPSGWSLGSAPSDLKTYTFVRPVY